MLFDVKNPHIYQTNSSVHCMNRRMQNKLHVHLVRLYSMHRCVYYSTIKILNHIPQNKFKFHNNLYIFKILLRDHLVKMPFISLRDFFFWSWYSAGNKHLILCSIFFSVFNSTKVYNVEILIFLFWILHSLVMHMLLCSPVRLCSVLCYLSCFYYFM